MVQADFREGELFYEPPKLYPESVFEIDGIKVRFVTLQKQCRILIFTAIFQRQVTGLVFLPMKTLTNTEWRARQGKR